MLELKYLRFFGTVLLIFSFFSQIQAQKPGPLLGSISKRTGLLLKDSIVNQIIQNSSGDRTFDYVSQISQWDRLAASEGYTRAAEWVEMKAGEFGLEQVRIEGFPCDGKIEYFGQVMAPKWRVNKAELWMASPYSMRITSYDELPLCLAINSTTSDVEAELVDIGTGARDEDYAAGVKGRIVLTTSNPAMIFNRAVIKEGALGVISSWSVPSWDFLNRQPDEFPDQVGWAGIPLKRDEEQSHFAFQISSRHAADILSLMQGNAVRIHAKVEAEVTPGKLEVVNGIIPGSKYPDEEIIVSAHLCHYKPGANDNASGSAAILEMARTMKEMIDKKIIPQPLRTIRFIWVPEYNGSYAWLSAHLNDPVRRIANLNFDMVGENTVKTNALMGFNYTSDSNPSFINALIESIVDFANKFNGERYPSIKDMYIGSVQGTRNRLDCRMLEYTTGTDHELYNNLKIAASTLGSWPDYFYHSSEDTPDKVDPTQLHRAVVMGLSAIATLSYMDDPDCNSLAELTLLYARKRIAKSDFTVLQSIYASGNDNFHDADHFAAVQIAHSYRREKESIAAVDMFARTTDSKDGIKQRIALLDEEEQQSLRKADNSAILKANELGLTRKKPHLTDSEEKASKLIPVRIKGKELNNMSSIFSRPGDQDAYADVFNALSVLTDELRNQGKSELVIMGIQDVPSYYADGSRSIVDIRNDIAAEYGATLSTDILKNYFLAFEKAGIIRLVQK